MKTTLLEVVREELEQGGHEVNVSRLAVLTGLQRKDIRVLSQPVTTPRENANFLSRVMGQWQNHPDFKTKSGLPRTLNFEGAESDFAKLVRSISVDVNPYTVLFALEQSGAVKREGKKISLIQTVYEPKGDSLAALELLAQDSANMIRAVEENIFEGPAVPNLHIATVFDNVCLSDLSKIREWMLDKGTAFHEEARSYIAKYDKDANPRLYNKEGGGQVALCAFSLAVLPKTGGQDGKDS